MSTDSDIDNAEIENDDELFPKQLLSCWEAGDPSAFRTKWKAAQLKKARAQDKPWARRAASFLTGGLVGKMVDKYTDADISPDDPDDIVEKIEDALDKMGYFKAKKLCTSWQLLGTINDPKTTPPDLSLASTMNRCYYGNQYNTQYLKEGAEDTGGTTTCWPRCELFNTEEACLNQLSFQPHGQKNDAGDTLPDVLNATENDSNNMFKCKWNPHNNKCVYSTFKGRADAFEDPTCKFGILTDVKNQSALYDVSHTSTWEKDGNEYTYSTPLCMGIPYDKDAPNEQTPYEDIYWYIPATIANGDHEKAKFQKFSTKNDNYNIKTSKRLCTSKEVKVYASGENLPPLDAAGKPTFPAKACTPTNMNYNPDSNVGGMIIGTCIPLGKLDNNKCDTKNNCDNMQKYTTTRLKMLRKNNNNKINPATTLNQYPGLIYVEKKVLPDGTSVNKHDLSKEGNFFEAKYTWEIGDEDEDGIFEGFCKKSKGNILPITSQQRKSVIKMENNGRASGPISNLKRKSVMDSRLYQLKQKCIQTSNPKSSGDYATIYTEDDLQNKKISPTNLADVTCKSLSDTTCPTNFSKLKIVNSVITKVISPDANCTNSAVGGAYGSVCWQQDPKEECPANWVLTLKDAIACDKDRTKCVGSAGGQKAGVSLVRTTTPAQKAMKYRDAAKEGAAAGYNTSFETNAEIVKTAKEGLCDNPAQCTGGKGETEMTPQEYYAESPEGMIFDLNYDMNVKGKPTQTASAVNACSDISQTITGFKCCTPAEMQIVKNHVKSEGDKITPPGQQNPDSACLGAFRQKRYLQGEQMSGPDAANSITEVSRLTAWDTTGQCGLKVGSEAEKSFALPDVSSKKAVYCKDDDGTYKTCSSFIDTWKDIHIGNDDNEYYDNTTAFKWKKKIFDDKYRYRTAYTPVACKNVLEGTSSTTPSTNQPTCDTSQSKLVPSTANGVTIYNQSIKPDTTCAVSAVEGKYGKVCWDTDQEGLANCPTGWVLTLDEAIACDKDRTKCVGSSGGKKPNVPLSPSTETTGTGGVGLGSGSATTTGDSPYGCPKSNNDLISEGVIKANDMKALTDAQGESVANIARAMNVGQCSSKTEATTTATAAAAAVKGYGAIGVGAGYSTSFTTADETVGCDTLAIISNITSQTTEVINCMIQKIQNESQNIIKNEQTMSVTIGKGAVINLEGAFCMTQKIEQKTKVMTKFSSRFQAEVNNKLTSMLKEMMSATQDAEKTVGAGDTGQKTVQLASSVINQSINNKTVQEAVNSVMNKLTNKQTMTLDLRPGSALFAKVEKGAGAGKGSSCAFNMTQDIISEYIAQTLVDSTLDAVFSNDAYIQQMKEIKSEQKKKMKSLVDFGDLAMWIVIGVIACAAIGMFTKGGSGKGQGPGQYSGAQGKLKAAKQAKLNLYAGIFSVIVIGVLGVAIWIQNKAGKTKGMWISIYILIGYVVLLVCILVFLNRQRLFGNDQDKKKAVATSAAFKKAAALGSAEGVLDKEAKKKTT